MTDETQTQTPTLPVNIIKRHAIGEAQPEWAIENHRHLKTGHVDWRGTAQELANQLGPERELHGQTGRLLHNTRQDIQWHRNRTDDITRDILTPLRTHWLRFLLPASVRAAL